MVGEVPLTRADRRRAAVAGMAGAAVALAAGELLAGLIPGVPSLVVSVGTAVIDHAPSWVKEFAVAVFGLHDKLALNLGIAAVAVALGAALGVAALRRPRLADAGFAAFGLLGYLAALRQRDVTPALAALAAIVGVIAGLVTLRWLLRAALAAVGLPSNGGVSAPATLDRDHLDAARRRFLMLAGGALAGAAVSAAVGRARLQRLSAFEPQPVPPPAEPLTAPPPVGFEIPGLTPLVVPNDRFYRIDVSLVVPRVDLSTWRLKVSGMVDRELSLSYDELLALPLIERYITIACVSNEIGGGLVGNARWRGVRLRDVLDRAGARPGATQIVGRAVDGFTVGFPTQVVHDGRDAMIAVGMNGESLPAAHGFPARLIVPGLYGYVSATKWLEEIQLTTLEAFDAYWVPRGWAKFGPIKTQSRIDVPRAGRLPPGARSIAGVAWAPHIGISSVEVAVDDGPWRPAELSTSLSDDSWVQWRVDWDAPRGQHTLRVRATDKTGYTQTPEVRDPFPSGATGYHTVRVTVA